jgi:hypothetical protein
VNGVYIFATILKSTKREIGGLNKEEASLGSAS